MGDVVRLFQRCLSSQKPRPLRLRIENPSEALCGVENLGLAFAPYAVAEVALHKAEVVQNIGKLQHAGRMILFNSEHSGR